MEEQAQKNLGYHYTSVNSFMKLLDGIEKGNFKFHASSIFSLNDPSEMVYGYGEIMKLLPKIEKELSIDDTNYKLSELWNKDPRFSMKDWTKIHLKKMEDDFLHSCIISYSRNRDNLQMWGMYGNNGKGVALGFDLRVYYIEQPFQGGWRMLDMAYLGVDKPHSIDVEYDTISSLSVPYCLVKSEYKRYWEKVQDIMGNEEIAAKQLEALTQMMIIAAPFVKHNAYQYENESRIIQVHKSIDDIKFKPKTNGSLTPYIEVDIPKTCLKEVIVGPCCDFDLMKKCIEIKLYQKGIGEVEINPSSIPYRS